MKVTINMVNRIGRFAYPIYFYANELKVKLLVKINLVNASQSQAFTNYSQA